MKIPPSILKSHMSISMRSAIPCTLLALVLTIGSASGAILIVVDVSDPSAVTLTATDGLASASTDPTENDGFDLAGFLTADIGTGNDLDVGATMSSIVALESATPLNWSWVNEDWMNIFDVGGDDAHVTAGQQAFSGSATFDLSAAAALLPAPGATGDLRSNMQPGTEFGEWVAVPEPSVTLLGLSCSLFVFRRRR